MKPRPKITCLCGSTRFYAAFQEANYRETMAGRVVLSVAFDPHAEAAAHGQERGCTPGQKAALDELHLRKIEMADEVLVLDCPRGHCADCGRWYLAYAREGTCDCGGLARATPYVGDSTRRKIAHAEALGKPVRYLSREGSVP